MVGLHDGFLAHSNLAAMHVLVLGVGLLQVSSILVLRLLSLVAQIKVHHLALFHANLARNDAPWSVLDVVL